MAMFGGGYRGVPADDFSWLFQPINPPGDLSPGDNAVPAPIGLRANFATGGPTPNAAPAVAAPPRLPYDMATIYPSSQRGNMCQLVAPTGNYLAPHATALFQPGTANALSSAISNLNSQGVTPTITDGYRSEAMQEALRRQYRAGHSPGARPAAGISGHQVASAVDIGPGSNPGHVAQIADAMAAAGFANGANFRNNPDAFHFMLPGTNRRQTQAMADACAAAYRRR